MNRTFFMGKDFFYIVENSARAGGAVAPPRARVHACVCVVWLVYFFLI